jgi:beta-galactosidase/beta-glucuronidase
VLKGAYGKAAFEQAVSLAAGEERLLKLDAADEPALHLEHPKLWWPKGYGEQCLYDVSFSFEVNGNVTDTTVFKSGVRQMTYDENDYKPSGGASFGFFGQSEPRRLSIYINGRRYVGFGGNWGFSESNLNYRKREYDIAVAYHADMNFTMIRNWVGQIGDEEFYEACDRYGVMV